MTAPGPTGKKRILVVDDDVHLLLYLDKVLRRDYDVVLARGGPEAVELLEQGLIPDLLITDIEMPEVDGYGVVAVLRVTKATAAVPIIFLTARSKPDDVIEAIQLGARNYVTKPFKLDDLLEKIRKALEASRRSRR